MVPEVSDDVAGLALSRTTAVAVWRVLVLRRRERCLYYCFMEWSDWTHRKLTEIRDDVTAQLPRSDDVPDSVAGAEARWKEHVSESLAMMQRAGVPRRRHSDAQAWVFEDLESG